MYPDSPDVDREPNEAEDEPRTMCPYCQCYDEEPHAPWCPLADPPAVVPSYPANYHRQTAA